jgi:MerR family transcriptional regulator, heat shock protein HspR
MSNIDLGQERLIMKRKKGYFSISAVAQMFSVHQQTIRFYEKEGLITPKRSDGNTRLFSEDDVNRLEEIIYLTHKVGINLAGVEMILKLQRQIKKMQKEMNDLFKKAQDELEIEQESVKKDLASNAQRLAALKQEKSNQKNSPNLVDLEFIDLEKDTI